MDDKQMYGNTANYIKVLEAHKAGKTIEVRPKGAGYAWRDLGRMHDEQGNDTTDFDFGLNYYRVKEESEKRYAPGHPDFDAFKTTYKEFCTWNYLDSSRVSQDMYDAYMAGEMEERGFDVMKLDRVYRHAYVDRMVKNECWNASERSASAGRNCDGGYKVSEEDVAQYIAIRGKLEDVAKWAFEMFKKKFVAGKPMIAGEYCRFDAGSDGLTAVSWTGASQTIPWETVRTGKVAAFVQNKWVESLITTNSVFDSDCGLCTAAAEQLARDMVDKLKEKYGEEKMGYSLSE